MASRWRAERANALRAVESIQRERAVLDEREVAAVLHAREKALDWTSIARALGLSRTVAHRRFAHHEPAPMWGQRRRGRPG